MTAMPTLALVRHADYQQQANTPSAWQPWPLSELGWQQVQTGAIAITALSQVLALPISPVIHCSTLLRAWQTAHGLTQALGLPTAPIASDALTERSVGAAANLNLDDISRAIELDPRQPSLPTHWKSDPDFRLPVPGAESLVEAGQRVAKHCQTLAHAQRGFHGMIIIVGHGAALRHGAVSLGVFDRSTAMGLSMHHAQPVLIQWQQGRWQHIAGDWKQRTERHRDVD